MDPDRASELLQQERARIEQELKSLRADNGSDSELSHLGQHNADAGSDLFEAELDQSQIERLEAELAAVERAEKRLEQGTYGVSIDSGEQIPDGRLEAMPAAERTAEEQTRYES